MTRLHFDPETLPVDSTGEEGAITPGQMTPHALRQRFLCPPAWAPEITVERLAHPMARALIPAAVLIPLIQRENGLTLMLTRRAAHLHDHAGQISFPGGHVEAYDGSSVDAALRETEEEVGLARHHVEVLGSLPPYHTATGFCVTPVVALVVPPFDIAPEPSEVAEVFEVPLAFLMNAHHHQRRTAQFQTGERTFYVMPYERFFIWGATAGMLRNLFHFLRV